MEKLVRRCKLTKRCSAVDKQLFDKIDDQVTSLMLKAEKECTKKRHYGHPFSPALVKAGQAVRMAKKKLHGIQITQASQSTPLTKPQERTLKQASGKLHQAWKALQRVQDKSASLRDQHLARQADTARIETGMSSAKAIQAIKRKELQRDAFQLISRHINPNTKAPLTRILVPKVDGSGIIEVADPEVMAQALLDQAKKHFGQAKDTPMVAGPIAEHIGPFEYNEASEKVVMEGDMGSLPTDPMEEVQDMLKALRRDPDVTDIDLFITAAELKSSFKVTKEATASSPSGRHYGHYKAAMSSPKLIDLYTSMINFTLDNEHAPPRWLRATQIPIEKVPGNPRVDKLRTLQLLEGDMQRMMQIIWARRMVWNAEDKKQLMDNQMGSRKGKSALSAVLFKRLSYDIIRQRREAAAVFNNDASGCYDRMIPSIAMMACRALGLPRKAARLKLRMLQKMKYFVEQHTVCPKNRIQMT